MDVLSEFGMDEERLIEIITIHDKSFEWFHDNLQEIQESYSGKFVAIYKDKIVESDEERGNLFQKLREKYNNREIEEIFVDYVNPKGYFLILFLDRE